MLDASSIGTILEVYRPERSTLTSLLEGLGPDEWGRSTECPAYSVKGVAMHILGDDLSLLSRQRDQAENGLSLLLPELPGSTSVPCSIPSMTVGSLRQVSSVPICSLSC